MKRKCKNIEMLESSCGEDANVEELPILSDDMLAEINNAPDICNDEDDVAAHLVDYIVDNHTPQQNIPKEPRIVQKRRRPLRFFGNLSTKDFSSRIIQLLKVKLKNEKQKNRHIRRQLLTKSKQIVSLSNTIERLKNQSSNDTQSTPQGNHIVNKLRCGKLIGKFPKEVRSFALSLNFYSPRAYEYVRKVFDMSLPCSRTIQKWYESVNGEPGLSSEIKTILKKQSY